MRDYIELGTTPCGEDCAQVGSEGYYERAMFECKRYIRQLQRMFPIPDDCTAHYSIRSFPHDFGTYHEVVIYYDDNDMSSIDYAFIVEGNLPEQWDDVAKRELQMTDAQLEALDDLARIGKTFTIGAVLKDKNGI